MNHYGPIELLDENGEPSGTYHYCHQRNSRITAMGYCGGVPNTIPNKIIEEFGNKFHAHGHETKEEAVECYTEYCLDLGLTFYDDEDTDYKKRHGISPHNLSEPIEDDDVPADIQGAECQHPDCETVVACQTAIINTPGLPDKMYLCSDHCNHESVAEFWSAPSNSFGSF